MVSDASLGSWTNTYLIRDIAVNIALYILFGTVGLLARAERGDGQLQWRDYVFPVLFAFLLSVTVELVQIYEPGRSSSAIDVVCNTCGTLLGVGLAAGFRTVIGKVTKNVCSVAPWWAWSFLAALVVRGLWPFRFAASKLSAHGNAFSFIPFGHLIAMDGPGGMLLLTGHFCGSAVAIWLLRASGKSLTVATGLVMTAVVAVELAGIFSPGAVPGITNPLLNLLAGYVLGEVGDASFAGNATNRYPIPRTVSR